eukprot:2325099-Rhodomonas_salina.1
MSGAELAYGATRDVVLRWPVLRACYAMSGTELAYGAARSLELAYGATRLHAMSGTELAYGATRLRRGASATRVGRAKRETVCHRYPEQYKI